MPLMGDAPDIDKDPFCNPYGSKRDLFIGGQQMPTALTLKNIPEELYARLKAMTELNKRSINSEALVCLETVLAPGRFTVNERKGARARALREEITTECKADELDTFKQQGRV